MIDFLLSTLLKSAWKVIIPIPQGEFLSNNVVCEEVGSDGGFWQLLSNSSSRRFGIVA